MGHLAHKRWSSLSLDNGIRCNKPYAEPKWDAGQFSVAVSQKLHGESVRTLQQKEMPRKNLKKFSPEKSSNYMSVLVMLTGGVNDGNVCWLASTNSPVAGQEVSSQKLWVSEWTWKMKYATSITSFPVVMFLSVFINKSIRKYPVWLWQEVTR